MEVILLANVVFSNFSAFSKEEERIFHFMWPWLVLAMKGIFCSSLLTGALAIIILELGWFTSGND